MAPVSSWAGRGYFPGVAADPDLKARFREVMLELAGDDGDLGYMDDALPALMAFVTEYATPEFECAMCGLPPTPPVVWSGVQGLGKAWEDYGGSFERVRVKLVEIRESATHTAVIVDQHATTRHGGVTLSQPSAMVFAFKDEQVERVEFHLDRAAALRSAGVEG
jgi:ketosteroid isomerase-like protein